MLGVPMIPVPASRRSRCAAAAALLVAHCTQRRTYRQCGFLPAGPGCLRALGPAGSLSGNRLRGTCASHRRKRRSRDSRHLRDNLHDIVLIVRREVLGRPSPHQHLPTDDVWPCQFAPAPMRIDTVSRAEVEKDLPPKKEIKLLINMSEMQVTRRPNTWVTLSAVHATPRSHIPPRICRRCGTRRCSRRTSTCSTR